MKKTHPENQKQKGLHIGVANNLTRYREKLMKRRQAWDDGKSSSCVKGRKSERQHLEFGKHERISVFIKLDGLTRYNLNQINLIGFELVSTTDLFHFKLKSNYLKH